MKKKLSNSNQVKKVCTVLALVLISVMTCGAQIPWNGTVAESYAGGDGTSEKPYQIATAEQLALFAYEINNGVNNEAHFILVDDINLNGANGQMWTAIGTVMVEWLSPINYVVVPAYPFMGVFDGDDHVISDMYVNNADVLGLFGCTYFAEVKNIRIENANVTQGASVGIVVGEAFNTNIEGCTVSGEVMAYGNKVGGIAGHYIADNIGSDTVFIKDCVNNANVTGGTMFLGGIAGNTEMNDGVFAIEHCVNNGEIGDMWNTGTAGGIVGKGDFIIRHCDNYGKVSGDITAGGMVGQGGSFGLIEFCFNHPAGEVTGGSSAGGIIGTPIFTTIRMSGNMATVTGDARNGMILVGGIAGSDGSISNCFNTGNLIGIITGTPETAQMGGITGSPTEGFVYNVYNAGQITKPTNPALTNQIYGHIIPAFFNENDIRNCYYYGNEDIPAYVYNIGSSSYSYLPESSAFNEGGSPTSWVLDDAQYGTTDLIEALNAGAMNECVWVEDTEGINGGFPLPQPKQHDVAVDEVITDSGMVDIYPNPGGSTLNIRTALQDAHVEVYDMNGRLVHCQSITENVTSINATDWAKGAYVWKVLSGERIVEGGKWVKE